VTVCVREIVIIYLCKYVCINGTVSKSINQSMNLRLLIMDSVYSIFI
jgi:hypothetical protein